MRFFHLAALIFFAASTTFAFAPEFTAEGGRIRIKGVGPGNPIIYDNDWWTDVPDAAYVWAKASAGKCDLRANIITRCTFGWETKYAHTLKQQTDEADRLFALAQESGFRNVPKPVTGSTVAMRKPATGKIEDTEFERTEGSRAIVREALRATPEKPLLVFVGGSCTTMAAAYLSEPSITNRVVVFQIDGGAYNGSDKWAWEITAAKFPFVNWARGYFWDKIATWDSAPFQQLPKNPMCDFLREHAKTDLWKANQWGDGAWLFELFAPGCLTAVERYADGITVPREGNQLDRMRAEFIATMSDKGVYHPAGERRD